MHRRADEDAARRNQLNRRGLEAAPLAVPVHPRAVLDRRDARLRSGLDALHAVRVRRHRRAARCLHHHLELTLAEDGLRWVRARRAHSARRHHLDHVDAALELPRNHVADRRLAAHLATPLVAVAAHLREWLTRAQQARADARTLLDEGPQRERASLATEVAGGRDAVRDHAGSAHLHAARQLIAREAGL